MPSLREYAARWGITPERIRPGQKVMHPGPINRGVEIDGRVADSPRLADPRAGALRARGPDGGAPGAARRAAGARGGRMTLFCKNGRSDSLVLEGRLARRRVRRGHGRERRDRADRAGRRDRQRARARLRRPARPPAHAGTRGRGDDRERHRGGRGRRLLRDPGDAEHRSGRRLGGRARLARRGRAPRGARPDRLHGRDLEAARRRGADRDGRARRRRRRRVHRRRPPRHLGGPDAPRAPVRRDHRPQARAALRGADALARRPGARGDGLRRARLRGLPVGRRERDGRARPLARRLRGAGRST